MYEFVCKKLTDRITQIIDPTGVSCFLAEGKDRAILIDTGAGFYGLKKTVEGLTGLPLTVILTHAHGDHAGGAGEFPDVYLHPEDVPLLKLHGLEKRMGYAAASMGPSAVLSREDFVPCFEGKIHFLAHGQKFDLGGLTAEIIHVPGHTRGCCSVLFPEERSILFGDACNINTLVMDDTSTSISEYQKSLERLKTYEERYDTVYYSHGPAVGPRETLEDNLELCGRILSGTDDGVPCEFLGRRAIRAAKIGEDFRRIDGKYGNIVYSELTKKWNGFRKRRRALMKLEDRVNLLLEGKGNNYIAPFFWQHGEEETVLREYMNKIHEANIGAVCVESRPHPDFAGDGWWRDMDVILDEAKKLSMKVWILDDKHFPTGYAAGAMENADKELCHQYLDYNVMETWGPRPQMEILAEDYAKPQPRPPWMPPAPQPKRVFKDDHLFRVLACKVEEKGKLGEIMDLTSLEEKGKIYFDVPDGYWKIYVIYFTRDARGRNDYINFLDEDSCKVLIDQVYEPHYKKYKELFGNVIAGFFSDEPPIGNTPGYTRGDLIGNPEMALPWSKEMAKAMDREYGPGWECMIPYLWAEGSDGQRTAHIRVAYMNAVSKLVSKCFSNQLGGWCQEHGVEYIGHMLEDCDSNANLGPSMGHFFRGLSGQHMAGIDNIGGQVMPGGMDVHRHEPDMCQDSAGFYHYMLGRMGASMAAIDPKKKGRCMCENFGAYGWRLGVRTEKYLNDHFMARGVNFFVPHAFTPKAFPDPDCPPHFYAHGENPQFRAFGELMAYTNRICQLIDGGIQDAPVALLYHGESEWAGAYESNILACRMLTRNQINFLLIPADVLADREEANTVFIKDEKTLSVNGVRCRALVISGCAYLTKAAAEFVLEARKTGFPVVFTGRLPEGISDTDQDDSKKLVNMLKDAKVVKTEDLDHEFTGEAYRSVLLEKAEPNLTVYRYRYEDGETCLLLNENTGRSIVQWITLPGVHSAAVYDPWENKRKEIPVRTTPEGIQVCIKLVPLEMLVLLCGLPGTEPEAEQKNPTREKCHILLEDFLVSRCAAKDYPAFMGQEEADLKYGMGYAHPEFSGFYRYKTTVETETSAFGAELVIQDAYEAAEVFVNGKSAGLRIAPPYRYDISGLLKKGNNEIAIEVATTLERKTASMGIRDGGMGPKAPLSPTGILGTVQIIEK